MNQFTQMMMLINHKVLMIHFLQLCALYHEVETKLEPALKTRNTLKEKRPISINY